MVVRVRVGVRVRGGSPRRPRLLFAQHHLVMVRFRVRVRVRVRVKARTRRRVGARLGLGLGLGLGIAQVHRELRRVHAHSVDYLAQ